MRHLPAAVLAMLVPLVAAAQVSPNQQAEMAVNAARKAYNDGNLPAAREQFKQILAKSPQQATAARYGLALTYIHAPEQDFAAAVEPLTQAAGDGGFADRGLVLYHLAVCQRMLGLQEAVKPNADPKAGGPKFEDALRRFGEAGGWFAGKKDDDWAVRCKCDAAEMQLRMGRLKDVRHTLEAVTKEPEFAKNKHRPLALYYYGLAAFADRDFAAAGKALNQLAPFSDPAVGLHARYLVGRVLHLNGETAEASVHYDTVLAEFDKQKKDAAEQLKQPDKFKGNPAEKTRLERLAAGPAPEHVAGAAFHGATLGYEAGKFADALPKFLGFATAYPASPLQPDALLRVGFCQVQLKQYDDAVKTLTPLADKFPKIADQTLFWLGKAQAGIAAAADPAKPAEREAKYKVAIATFRQADAKAIPPGQQWDAEARGRRGDILMDLGDTYQALKQFKEAAAVYDVVWKEKLLPERRREESLLRLAAATGAAGDIGNANYLCNEFKKQHPQSTLMPAVVFRIAENAYADAVKVPADANKALERKQKYEEAAHKYQEVVEKYPEFDRVSYARFGVAVCLSQNGDLEGAAKALDAIPAPDRNGELSAANYLLADCLIRLAPAKADDALAENIIREKLTNASGLLENYVASNPKAADAPDALLKLGLCLKRLGSTLADANERNTLLNKAREFYEKLEKEYPKSPQAGHARLEIAKVRALMGDRGGAMNDLRQFAGGDKQNSPVAPLAFVQLATLLREQNQPAEAAKVLEEARKKYEAALSGDKERAEWAGLLKYHHGVALFESGKLPEAKDLFAELYKATHNTPMGDEAALREAQASFAIARKQIELAVQERGKPNLKPDQVAAADRKAQQGREAIYRACEALERHCREGGRPAAVGESRARMWYDAAWAYRSLMDHEIGQLRTAALNEAVRKWTEEAAKPRPDGAKPPPKPDDVPFVQLQRPRAEERATNAYLSLVQDFPDLALAVDARLELAELLFDRDKYDDAVKHLKEAIDKEPTDRAVSPDLLERVRLKLGAALFAKKDYKAAATQFETVAGNAKSPHRGQAAYRLGESLFAQGEFAKAAATLAVFRDKPEFHNVGGVSDRALLRLGQSLAAAKQWEPARVAFETAVNRFPNGPFVPEARYGLGWAYQNQSRYDDAIGQYQAVAAATTAEVAAKAQTQLGLCKLAQKKYAEAAAALTAVAYTYDYPEVGYAATLEAARALDADGKAADADKLLAKLLTAVPADSEWAKAAKERLEKRPK